MNKLANRLLEKEVIFKDDLISILGTRPFAEKTETVITPKKIVKSEIFMEIFLEKKNLKKVNIYQRKENPSKFHLSKNLPITEVSFCIVKMKRN